MITDKPVLLSLTGIRQSNIGMGSRSTFELVYGLDHGSLTMRRTICLREAEHGGEPGGKGLEIFVLEGSVVHVRETRRDELRQTHLPRSYEFPWDSPQPLPHGGRIMGTIIRLPEASHAAHIQLASGVVLETETARWTRCWHCLTSHRVRNDQTMCGQQGCRGVLPPLTVPYPREGPGFEPVRRIERRTATG